MQVITVNRKAVSLPDVLSDLLPPQLCDAINRLELPFIEELRLHSDRYATVTSGSRCYRTNVTLSECEMQELLQRMCGGSLYAYSESICQGYLSLPNGIRVGVCGKAAVENRQVVGVSLISGLIVRIPHRLCVDATPIMHYIQNEKGLHGILVYAPPGVGKTTLLRAIARMAASSAFGLHTVVVDTREELFYSLDGRDLLLDALVGYPKEIGIEIAVRSLGAQLIVCDEIGSTEDARAILSASNCGVPLVASAHARDIGELLSRPALRALHQARVFDHYVELRRENGRFQYKIHAWKDAKESTE